MIDILPIAGEWTAYFGALALLAWRGERTTGSDSFHVVVAYLVGVSILVALADVLEFHPIPALMVAVLAAALVDRIGRILVPLPTPELLLGVLLAVAIALAIFDWSTSNAPIALVNRRSLLRWLAHLTALGLATWLLIAGDRKRLLIMRLGLRHRWAAEYWARPVPHPSAVEALGFIACWIPVLAIPAAATGLLGGTILRDSAIAIVLARVAGERHPLLLVGLAATIAVLRTSAGYLFSSSAASPMIEVSIFVALLLWARRRTTRSAWEQQLAR